MHVNLLGFLFVPHSQREDCRLFFLPDCVHHTWQCHTHWVSMFSPICIYLFLPLLQLILILIFFPSDQDELA